MSVVLIAESGQPLTISTSGGSVELRPKERVVVAAVALRGTVGITIEQLIGCVWPGGHPPSAQQSIHNHLARIRQRVPDLIATERSGYRLGDSVTVEVLDRPAAAGPDAEFLIELEGVPDLRQARADFARRHRNLPVEDPLDAIRSADADLDDVLATLERTVAAEPLDERAWWRLTIAASRSEGRASALRVIDRARNALLEVGLEPGRRLLDLEHLLQDGVESVDVLASRPHGEPRRRTDSSRSGSEWRDHRSRHLTAVRATWAEAATFGIVVRGPDSTARREFLALLVDDARANGFATLTVRALAHDIGRPTVRGAHVGVRPVVVVIDGAEHHTSLDALVGSIASAWDAGPAPIGWIVTAVDAQPVPTVRLGEIEFGLTIETPPDDDGVVAVVPSSEPARRLLAALALLGEPTSTDALEAIIPGVRAAALDAARQRLVRVDPATRLVDLAGPRSGQASLDSFSEEDRRQLTLSLLELDFPAISAARRETRRSSFALQALGPLADLTLSSTRRAADLLAAEGDHLAAAAVLQRTLDRIDPPDTDRRVWARLAVETGRQLLAGGDRSGDLLLAEAVDTAVDVADFELASSAALEWCRLGMAAGTGSFDDDRLAKLDALQQSPLAPRQRARVGAASCMVLSLAGRPDELRSRFVAAVDDACADDPLDHALGDVLPLTYMSLPRHADAERRLDLAAQLGTVAERTARPDSRWEALHLAYSTQVMTGDARCRTTFDELELVAESLHERSRAWEMCYVRSNQAILDGDLDQARSVIDESLGYAAMVNEARGAAVFGAHHLGAALLDGTAGALLDSIRELVRTQPGIGAWSAARAYAASIAGETNEAADALDHLLDGRTTLHDDPTYTAALVAAGEAAATLGDPVRAGLWLDLLDPLAGGWSWTGTCTFGPLDLTRARLALCVGDRRLARAAATAAVATTADMQAPLFSRRATELLLASFE